MNNTNNNLFKFSLAIYKRRKFLSIYILLTCILALSISLSVKKTYVSSATILTPSSSGFSSFLPPSMTEGLGGAIGALTSNPGSGLNTLMSILKSREIAEQIVDEFNLQDYLQAPTIEDAIEGFREMVSVTINEESMIRVSVYAQTELFHPIESEKATQQLAFDMAKHVIKKLDSINVALETQKATTRRLIVEKRYNQNREELIDAEKALMEFSDEFGVIALPEQLAASIQTAAELESQLIISRNELATYLELYGDSRKEIQLKEIEIKQTEKSLRQFLNTSFKEDSLSVLPAFYEGPSLVFRYTALLREQRVQEIIFEFLTQSYEQSKLEEAKVTPTLQYIDYPKLPTRKSAPSRALLSILITLISIFMVIAYIIFSELFIQDAKSFIYTLRTSETE